jgi:hypothetical protein
MYLTVVMSDQLYTWSDENPEPVHCCFAKRRIPLLRQLPRCKRFFAARSSSATNEAASRDASVRTAPAMAPNTICRSAIRACRPQMDYVPQELYAQTAEFLANYHRAREILEAISEINRELLRRREAL